MTVQGVLAEVWNMAWDSLATSVETRSEVAVFICTDSLHYIQSQTPGLATFFICENLVAVSHFLGDFYRKLQSVTTVKFK